MTRHSQAALFHGPNSPWEIRSAPTQSPSENEVLVQVLACTICGSDLHTICGRREAHTPAVLGHEIVGRIVQLGQNAPKKDWAGSPLNPGDRIVWTLVANCGNCFFCHHDLPQKCQRGYKYGHQQVTDEKCWHGGFATHCTLRSGTQIIKVPDSISDLEAAPLGCATATIAAALRTSKLIDCENVLVVGAGMLGLTACAFVHSRSPKLLACIERDDHRRSLAKSFGAALTAPPNAITLNPADATLPLGFDAVFECSGTNAGALEALRLVRTGGRIILVGAVFPSDPAPMVLEQIVRKQLTIYGVHNYHPQDLWAAVEFMEKYNSTFPFKELVNESFPLQEIETAINRAQQPQNIRVAILP